MDAGADVLDRGADRRPGQSSPVARIDRPLAVLLVAFAALATAWNVAVPVFEAPDEPQHFFVAQHLARTRTLPVQSLEEGERGPWEQEGSQPPLYYLLAAPLVALAPSDLEADGLWVNPQNSMGHPTVVGNDNRYIHPPAREGWPWHGYALAVHVVRGLSTLLAVLSVGLVWSIARRVFAGRREQTGGSAAATASAAGTGTGTGTSLALAAAALVAFNPQFLALAASVTNDNLVVLLACAALVLLSRIADGRDDRRTVAALAVAAGLSPLAKLSGLAVVAFAVATLGGLAWRRRDPRWFVRTAGPVVLATCVLAGWWYVRNLRLYGDLTGVSHMLLPAIRRDFSVDRWLTGLPGELAGLWYSSWGLFGWFTVMLPGWVYGAISVAAAGASLGLARAARARATWLDWRRIGWLVAWWALVFASLLRWLTIAKGGHGRLLFPAIAGLAVVLVAGWRALVPARLSDRAFAAALAFTMATLSTGALVGVVRPAYAWPETVAAGDVPATGTVSDTEFDGGLRLMHVTVPDRVVEGARVPVTLYWQLWRPVERDVLVALRLDQTYTAGRDPTTLAPLEATETGQAQLAYLGAGNAPPSLLAPGQAVYVDRRTLIAPALRTDGPRLPVEARLSIHLYDGSWHVGLGRPESPGTPIDVGVGIVIEPRDRLELPAATRDATTPIARWENGVSLLPVVPATTASGAVTWRTTATESGAVSVEPVAAQLVEGTWLVGAAVSDDLALFVHLVAPDGRHAGIFDRAPATHGPYPTDRWRPGDVLPVSLPWQVPADAAAGAGYRLEIGLYRRPDGQRVPAYRPDGSRWPDDAVVVRTVEVLE